MFESSAFTVLHAKNTRSYEHISDMLTFSALMIGGPRVLFLAEQKARFACRAANCDLIVPLKGFDVTLATGHLPEQITLFREKKMPPPESGDMPGVKSINTRIQSAIFATFASKANDWVKQNVSTDFYNWPPVSGFARVVRNAIAHGGTISLKDPKMVVSWSGVTFSADNYGEAALNSGKLSHGDLILLMIDLENELDDLGAPFNLD